MAKKDNTVYFNDPVTGEKVSNDPGWLAKKYSPNMTDTVSDPDLGENQSDEGVDGTYSSLSGKQLKAELKSRQEEGREISTDGITKKAQLAALLEADDVAQAEEEEQAAQEKAAAEADNGDSDDEEE